jgi:hypothetical protein
LSNGYGSGRTRQRRSGVRLRTSVRRPEIGFSRGQRHAPQLAIQAGFRRVWAPATRSRLAILRDIMQHSVAACRMADLMGAARAGLRAISARLEFGFRFGLLLKTKDRIGFVSSFYFGFAAWNPPGRSRIGYSDFKDRGVGEPVAAIFADLRKALLTRCEDSTAATEMGLTE